MTQPSTQDALSDADLQSISGGAGRLIHISVPSEVGDEDLEFVAGGAGNVMHINVPS